MKLYTTDAHIKGMLTQGTEFSKTHPISLLGRITARYKESEDCWLVMCANDSTDAAIVRGLHHELTRLNLPCSVCGEVITITGICCGCSDEKSKPTNCLIGGICEAIR